MASHILGSRTLDPEVAVAIRDTVNLFALHKKDLDELDAVGFEKEIRTWLTRTLPDPRDTKEETVFLQRGHAIRSGLHSVVDLRGPIREKLRYNTMQEDLLKLLYSRAWQGPCMATVLERPKESGGVQVLVLMGEWHNGARTLGASSIYKFFRSAARLPIDIFLEDDVNISHEDAVTSRDPDASRLDWLVSFLLHHQQAHGTPRVHTVDVRDCAGDCSDYYADLELKRASGQSTSRESARRFTGIAVAVLKRLEAQLPSLYRADGQAARRAYNVLTMDTSHLSTAMAQGRRGVESARVLEMLNRWMDVYTVAGILQPNVSDVAVSYVGAAHARVIERDLVGGFGFSITRRSESCLWKNTLLTSG